MNQMDLLLAIVEVVW